jgi:lipase chaperone LimK
MRNTLLGIAIGVACLVVVGVLGRGDGPRTAEPPRPAAAQPTEPERAAVEPRPPADAAGPAPSGSLAGTSSDGALVADASGRFLATPSALRLFDHFLSASGEAPPGSLLARIEAEIVGQLPASARDDARRLLDRHLAYREAARELHAEGLGEDDLDRRHQRLRELRREHFGPDSEALFGEEEQMARAALALRRVEQDPELSAEEKSARRAALQAELPENVLRAHREATLPAELARREQALLEAGATAGEFRALREEMVGAAAADRLEALDARRDAWNRRIEAYRLERDLALRTAPADDVAAVVERIRAERFDERERVRIRALDRSEGIGLTSRRTRSMDSD